MQIDLVITEKQLVDSEPEALGALSDRLEWFADNHVKVRSLENHDTRVIAMVDGPAAAVLLDAYQKLVKP